MAVSELSVLELTAERGELLPERETLQMVNIGNFAVVTQVGVNIAAINGNNNYVDQSIDQTQYADISQSFTVYH